MLVLGPLGLHAKALGVMVVQNIFADIHTHTYIYRYNVHIYMYLFLYMLIGIDPVIQNMYRERCVRGGWSFE